VSGFIGTGSLGEYYIGEGGLSLHTQLTFDTFVGLDLPLEITAAIGVSRNIEEHLKIMIELYVPSTYDGTLRVADIVALIYGFRVHWDHFAVDLSFIRVTFDRENEADTERLTGPGYTALEQFPLGLPYLSLSLRL
jgi:hypothetical protein